MALSHLLMRRLNCTKPISIYLLPQIPKPLYFSSLSSAPNSAHESSPTPKPTSLSARMNFLFEQIDEIDKTREEKDQTLQRIRAWRESKKEKDSPISDAASGGHSMEELKSELVKSEDSLANSDVKKEVELVHPWPEWIELMERLVQQNYFDHRRKDEDRMMEGLGFDLSEINELGDKGLDIARDFKTVLAAITNFGRDRFDILRSLSRQDLQILVGYGCPSADRKVVFSSKLLRKLVHLDEGDVCSSCSLRGSCEKAYLLTNKEDEARTIDVMRILLAYGFDPIDRPVANKALLKNKSVKTVVRKMIHEVVKRSAVPIDPNLPPPVIKRPPPKVKQAPPLPKKRVGRNDIEMKKGDWLCTKCEFMNFAKNTVCLQCDAKRPKRQLLPGEWECPQCNFLNYRRNSVCFHCEHKRPPDTYPESQFPEQQRGPLNRMDKVSPKREDVSNAWNFDFDDNESDGADVAAFEYADSQKLDQDFPINKQSFRENPRGYEDGLGRSDKSPKGFEREFVDSSSTGPGVGFNDFDEDDDDDVDSYELVAQNEVPKTSRIDFSELEADSESEDVESTQGNYARGKTKFQKQGMKKTNRKASLDSEDDEVDFDTDDDLPIHPNWKSSHVADQKQQKKGRDAMTFGSDDDFELSSGSDDEMGGNRRGSDGMNRARGGRSNFRASFSEGDSDDETIRSNDRGNRRGPNGMARGRGGRSTFKASFSESEDETVRSNDRGNRRGSNRMDRGRGGRSNFRSSFSESEDETMRSSNRGNRRGSNGTGRGRGGRSSYKASFSDRDSDDDLSYQSDRQRGKAGRNGPGRGSSARGGRISHFDRSSGRKSFSRGSREDSFSGRAKNGRDSNSSKFKSHNKRGGRSDNFENRSESYEVDEKDMRPRNNVR